MTYGAYSMYDNNGSRHNSVHFTPYQKPVQYSGRRLNDPGMYFPSSSNYQQPIAPQFNFQHSPPMGMAQMQTVQMQQPYADCQFGFDPNFNGSKQNMMPMTSPVMNQLANQAQQQQQQSYRLSQQAHQQQYYQHGYPKQSSYSPMVNRPPPTQAVQQKPYVQFPKMPVAVQSAPQPVKFPSPTVAQVLGASSKKVRKTNNADIGILHEFFNLNPTISELARRAEKLVMDMERKSKLPVKKNFVVRRELQQSVNELSGGPIRLNSKSQQPGYVPYKESVVPATPSPSSFHSQFSPICSDFSPSPNTVSPLSYF